MGVMRPQDFNVTSDGASERVSGAMVSFDLFPTLGVQPTQGRLFTATEDAPGVARVALIRESLWRRRLAASRAALGSTLALNGQPYTVIGILPDSTIVPYNDSEFWVPVGLWASDYENRRQHPGLRVIARLKPGITVESARTDLAAIAAQLAIEYPDSNRGNGVQLVRITDYLFKNVRPAMLVLSAAVMCVLLIACANVAGLLTVRVMRRRRELAIRLAVGSGHGRIVRLLLAESLLLGVSGAAVGAIASPALVAAIKSILPAATPRLAQVGVDTTVLAFSVLVGVVTGVVFGLLPVWRSLRTDITRDLSDAGRGSSSSRQRSRSVLIACEFALTAILLVSSGLMMHTLHRLYRADLGFATDRVLTFTSDLPKYAFSNDAARLAAEQRIMPRLSALPGVASVGYTSALPLTTRANFNGFTIEGRPPVNPSELPMADTANVSPGYFATMGIPLLRGRAFFDSDKAGAGRVAIIDSVLADRHFPGQDPIGRHLKIGDAASDLPWMEIVGVVRHIDKAGVDSAPGPQLYRPAKQGPGGTTFTFALRSATDPALLIGSVRQVFREATPDVPVFDFQSMRERFNASIWPRRLTALLLGVFASLAATLSVIGLYGLLSYAVSLRTREIGIRLALGATPQVLVKRVMRDGMLLAGCGSVVGLITAFGITQLMRGLLYETSPNDPMSFVVVACGSVAFALIGCFIPARRVAKVDPMVALRCE
jgi:putative ABC transport system permease protein